MFPMNFKKKSLSLVRYDLGTVPILRRLRIYYQNFDIKCTKIEKKSKILSIIVKIDFQIQYCELCKI
jgi:hypothetical protein